MMETDSIESHRLYNLSLIVVKIVLNLSRFWRITFNHCRKPPTTAAPQSVSTKSPGSKLLEDLTSNSFSWDGLCQNTFILLLWGDSPKTWTQIKICNMYCTIIFTLLFLANVFIVAFGSGIWQRIWCPT